jgi:hypothetical protein
MVGMGLGTRASMILYHLASDDSKEKEPTPSLATHESHLLLPPPKFGGNNNRDSIVSSSGSSFMSFDADAKYALSHCDSAFPAPRGLVAYAYDPALDELGPMDEGDIHDPSAKVKQTQCYFPWRGVLNITILPALTLGFLFLFVFYPVFLFYQNEARNQRIRVSPLFSFTPLYLLY